DAGLAGSPFPVIRQNEQSSGDAINVRLNWTISPRTTNEASWSIKRFNIILLPLGEDGVSPTRPAGLTIRDFFQGANTLNLIPQISLSQGWGGISTNQLPLNPARDDNWVV